MSRIGLTQRVEEVEDYQERRDCLDQQWGQLLQSFGLTPVPLCNQIKDVPAYVDQLELEGIVFTGGNDFAHLSGGTNVAPERDRFEQSLLEAAVDRELPVLGVCRGLQLVNLYCGGSLSGINGHIAVKHHLTIDPAVTPVTDRLDQVAVNSYHDYGVLDEDLGHHLSVAGRAPDGSIEWIEHEDYPITAIMWHPERDSPSVEFDRRIICHRLPTDLS